MVEKTAGFQQHLPYVTQTEPRETHVGICCLWFAIQAQFGDFNVTQFFAHSQAQIFTGSTFVWCPVTENNSI